MLQQREKAELKFLKNGSGITISTIMVEIAAGQYKSETGLMRRNHLAEDAGMLFILNESTGYNFWMKDTRIPLDMICTDISGKITRIYKRLKPYSEEILFAGADACYAVEVNGGYTDRTRIVSGDFISFDRNLIR